ncbi:uncharacterized protein G2W53_038835 [Senna tora]|uniref:Uncharacterized protein n=1 Tax=Senna tora TaxID=362788 RepID=A0A834W7B8_9FABA|nr:uncharacterized protein G2W53_038835 [Senna tora]
MAALEKVNSCAPRSNVKLIKAPR